MEQKINLPRLVSHQITLLFIILLTFKVCESQQNTNSTSRNILRTECHDFDVIPGSITVDGDVTLWAGFNMTSSACERACILQPNVRYCVGALIGYENSCILTSYNLHKSRRNIHYRRFCRQGRGCFKQIDGWRGCSHTGYVWVPEMFRTSSYLVADFCRKECESLPYCVMFDVRPHLRFCPFLEIRPTPHPHYTLHRRNCQDTG